PRAAVGNGPGRVGLALVGQRLRVAGAAEVNRMYRERDYLAHRKEQGQRTAYDYAVKRDQKALAWAIQALVRHLPAEEKQRPEPPSRGESHPAGSRPRSRRSTKAGRAGMGSQNGTGQAQSSPCAVRTVVRQCRPYEHQLPRPTAHLILPFKTCSNVLIAALVAQHTAPVPRCVALAGQGTAGGYWPRCSGRGPSPA